MKEEQGEVYYGSADSYVPEGGWEDVAIASKACKACHLWKCGTQTVFGKGPVPARVMMVGEQPGDREDQEGLPFVGPAGKVLHEAFAEAGMDPDAVYMTNAVKHFKWEPKGARRIHKRPNSKEVGACRPWLKAELRLVNPEIIVALGAIAAEALMGRGFKLMENRGKVLQSELPGLVIATVHPSSILRMPDREKREEARAAFIKDLRVIANMLQQPPGGRAYVL